MPRFPQHPHGQFSWIDLNSTDQAASEAFYYALFGWTATRLELPDGGHYTMFKQLEVPVAGCTQMRDEQKAEPGMHSYWATYIAVDDCAAIEARVIAAGGKVRMPTMDVMTAGKLCVIDGPDGAPIGLWQAGDHPGAGLCNEPFSLAWSELASRDVDAAKAFFAEVLGWEYLDRQMGPMTYTMIRNRGRTIGGMLPMSGEWGELPSHWMAYVSVRDLESSTRTLTSLGGRVLHGPMEGDPGVWSVVAAPTGEVFSMIELEAVTGPGPDL